MGQDTSKQDGSWPGGYNSNKPDHCRAERRSRETSSDNSQLEDRGNPFALFKQFIDDSVTGVSDGFRNFPTNVQELKVRMQREQERRQQEEQEISTRWTGSSNSPDHIQMELLRSSQDDRDDAHSATIMLLSEALRRNADVSPDKIERLYEDKESMLGDLDRLVNPLLALGGAWFYMPETGDKLPTAEERSLRWFGPMPRWLSVDWFKRSPYSPISLEAHPDLGQSGAKWRAAFEDLLDATLDKPMGSMERVGMREPHGKPQSTYYGPGLEWMLSLQCRGILPPQLPRFYSDMSGKRALRQGSILNILASSRTDLPWSSDHALAWYSPVHRDFSDLMSEIATKATAETEVDSIYVQKSLPETELDVYESPYVFPPAPVYEKPTSQTRPPAVSLTGDYIVDLDEAEWALWEALHNKDIKTATSVLNEWHRQYQDISELVEEPLGDLADNSLYAEHSEWHPVLNEALRQSNLPDSDPHKQQAFDPKTAQLEDLDKMPLEEKWLQRQIQKQGDELAGKPLAWPPCSTAELVRRVEQMEEENENLLQMTGETKPTIARPEEQVEHTIKKPEVLSALTTTQTTRLPDGTVTTKVVLKKRFADGREETTESIHTTNEKLEQQQHDQAEKQDTQKKGWFWS